MLSQSHVSQWQLWVHAIDTVGLNGKLRFYMTNRSAWGQKMKSMWPVLLPDRKCVESGEQRQTIKRPHLLIYSASVKKKDILT